MKFILFVTTLTLFNLTVAANKLEEKKLYLNSKYPEWKWVESEDNKTLPIFRGQVKDGKPDGLGILISTNGWSYFGNWKNGKIFSGTEYDNYGNIIYLWLEGKRKFHNLYKSY